MSDEQQVAPEFQQEQPVIVQAKPVESPKMDPDNIASSASPYHSANTEKIQEERTEETKQDEDKPFEYEANGYTVKQRKAEGTEVGFADEKGDVYEVEGNDLHRVYGNKTDALIFATTHSADFAKRGNIPAM